MSGNQKNKSPKKQQIKKGTKRRVQTKCVTSTEEIAPNTPPSKPSVGGQPKKPQTARRHANTPTITTSAEKTTAEDNKIYDASGRCLDVVRKAAREKMRQPQTQPSSEPSGRNNQQQPAGGQLQLPMLQPKKSPTVVLSKKASNEAVKVLSKKASNEAVNAKSPAPAVTLKASERTRAPKPPVEEPLKPLDPNVKSVLQEFLDLYNATGKLEEDLEALEMGTAVDDRLHLICCQNLDRNRFPKDVHCLDDTRVIIQNEAKGGEEFYHANKCKFPGADRDYIVAQAPMAHTAETFWKMIFQEQSPTVVVLCNFYENGREASESFWPMKTGEHKYYGTMFLNNKKKETAGKMTAYTIEVLPDGCSNSLLTNVYHYVLWKDYKLIDRPNHLVDLRRAIKPEPSPMTIVSCRGIGRAPSFAAIDVILTRLFKGIKCRAVETVLEFRKQRCRSVTNAYNYYDVVSIVSACIRAKFKKLKDQKNIYKKGSDEKLSAEQDEKQDGGMTEE